MPIILKQKINMATNEEKAVIYDSLLREYDNLAAKIRSIEVKTDLTSKDHKEIKTLKEEMQKIMNRALSL